MEGSSNVQIDGVVLFFRKAFSISKRSWLERRQIPCQGRIGNGGDQAVSGSM